MRSARWLFVATCGPLFGLALIALVIRGTFALQTPSELDYGEGIVLWQAAHITDANVAYHRIDVAPHIVFHYPPLYHLAARGVALVTGDLLLSGRLVSLVSLVVVCVILALLTWHCLPRGVDQLSRWIGASSAGLLALTLPVWGWARIMRVDALAMLLSFSGVACFIMARKRPTLVYLAFLLFVAAVYTKQVMVAAPAACFLLLLIEDPRRAARAAAVALAAGFGVLAMLQSATHGLFWRNIISYNANPFDLGQMLRMELAYVAGAVVVLASALALPTRYLSRVSWTPSTMVGRVRGLMRRDQFGRATVVTTLTLVFGFAVTVTCGKIGASYNYFFEVDLAAALGSGLFLGWLMRDRPQRVAAAHVPFALFVTVLFAIHSIRAVGSFFEAKWEWELPPHNYSSELVRYLAAMPGPVYSENMVLLVQAGKEIAAEPAIITTLASTGQWDESAFVQSIANGHFAAVVIGSDLSNRHHFSPAVASAIEKRYAVVRTFGIMKIFQPRPGDTR